MRYIMLGIAITACARGAVPQTSSETIPPPHPKAECYALAYSDPAGGANEKMFPTWIELFPGTYAEGGNLPDFLRREPKDHKVWQTVGADSVRVLFTSTAEGVDIHAARVDSGLVGRAIWVTDLLGIPEKSMHVTGTRTTCPTEVSGAKSG